MNKSFKLLAPMMPNFISYEAPASPKQDGFSLDGNKISITELSEQEAVEYGELMKQAFIEHWKLKTSKQ